MVGFLRDPIIIEEKLEDPDYNSLSIDPSIIDIKGFSSSFLDIDSLSDWTEVDKAMDDLADLNPHLGKADSGGKLGDLGALIEEEVAYLKPNLEKADLGEKSEDFGTLIVEDVADLNPNLEKADSAVKLEDMDTLIKEEMGKVKLVEVADPSLNANGFGRANANVKSERVESGSSSSDSESDSEFDSSLSDSSSSSEEEDEDDDDGGEVKEKVDMEDGEIGYSDVEKMVAWSEDELEDEDGGVSKEPIKSKNELTGLPHVPPVDVSLQSHHHTVPVGVISSIMSAQVIVEGVEQHNPLNEGTIFWITESRSPLGLVDEIFGPVKGPYYIIRYNSENEIPEGITQGTSISFVSEFANHVLNDNLYKKGYDASGDNDEEISDDYEFSDDEKEADYRKLQKMKKKRGTNEANCRNGFKERKNFKNLGGGSSQHNQILRNRDRYVQNNVLSIKSGGSDNVPQGTNEANCGDGFKERKNFKNLGGGSSQHNQFLRNRDRSVQNNVLSIKSGGSDNVPQGGATQVATNQNQQYGTAVATSVDNGNHQNQFGAVQNYGNAPSFVPLFQQAFPDMGFTPPPSVLWMSGMPGQQGMVFPNGMMWPQQNLLSNGVTFSQQFAPNQNIPSNGALLGAAPNQNIPSNGASLGAAQNQNFPSNGPLLGAAQNQNFQPNGVFPVAQPNFFGAPSFGPSPVPFAQSGSNQQFGFAMPVNMNGQRPPTFHNTEVPQEFNHGAYRGGGLGRGPHHRGGQFRGGRGHRLMR